MSLKKTPYTATLYAESLERIRDAAHRIPGETVSSLMEKGALELIARLERERGAAFPPREGDARTERAKKRGD